ncbi:hypothetical protein DENSPDRAFT_790166 [Dentipellis sp. KUC8613]|nr:hypothetical protein DENSPDRAFT_790166 [Dentipellis sp. KUC8613]
MLCNWSKAANVSLRGIVQNRTLFTSTFRHGHLIASPVLDSTQSKFSSTPSNFFSFSSNALHTTPTSHEPLAALALTPRPVPPIFTPNPRPSDNPQIPPSESHLPKPSVKEDIFTGNHSPAQLSRATSAAIRHALQRKQTWDAFHLYHSVRWSWYHYGKPTQDGEAKVFKSPFRTFQPIDLGQAIHPKLACHALMHGLLRNGEYRLAGKLAHGVMKDGILKTKTFQTVIAALHSKMNVLPEDFQPPRVDRIKGKPPHIVTLGSILPSEPLTELAVLLLRGAHNHRWQRTQAMYDTTINACLMQGEIIVASLLLALLIKEFQLNASRPKAAEPAETGFQEEIPMRARSSGRKLANGGTSFDSSKSFTKVLLDVVKGIEEGIAKGPHDPQFGESTQSLAVLAGMLSRKELPTSRVASLIKAMYSYPESDFRVWVTAPNGEQVKKVAYKYFHSVLQDLVHSLPSTAPAPGSRTFLQPLDLPSYNALLHYALRQRCSLKSAQLILDHMTSVRKPPLCPDSVTYNILLKSSTLMRRNDIASDVLSAIRDNLAAHGIQHRFMLPFMHAPVAAVQPKPDPKVKQITDTKPSSNSKLSRLLTKISDGKLRVPASQGKLKIDRVTLCSYIDHLVSIGNPDAVANVLVLIFPEFTGPAGWQPSDKPYPDEVLDTHRQAWDESIQRAIYLGPYFFATVLNALSKAGRTGLCERIWYLAKKTEKASWASPTPWNLSIDAYTSMLQCYAKEARKALGTRRRTASGVAPTSDCKKDLIVGWALHEVQRREAVGRPEYRRRILSVRIGTHIFNSVRRAARAVHAELEPAQDGQPRRPTHDLPVPDERFYNAILDVYGRAPGIFARQARPSRSHWRQRLRSAVDLHDESGEKSKYWRTVLQRIVFDMRERGFFVPAGFREMMVGAWPGAMPMGVDEPSRTEWRHRRRYRLRRRVPARPYAFPREPERPSLKPHALQTVKTKGLPVRRGTVLE